MSTTTTTPATTSSPFTGERTGTMRAAVFVEPNRIEVREVPRPHASAGEAVIRVTLTTICGTDVHILRGEYPVRPGLVVGHEAVGVTASSSGWLEPLTIGYAAWTLRFHHTAVQPLPSSGYQAPHSATTGPPATTR